MYYLKRWNNQYGRQSRFVAFNPATNQYTEYSPYRPNDVTWVNQNLTLNPSYKDWEDWKNEPIVALSDPTM